MNFVYHHLLYITGTYILKSSVEKQRSKKILQVALLKVSFSVPMQ
jgi:hypothetical protein